jgi:hypothetical protein
MARRLALLSEDSHEGPWTRASGSESAVRVKGLGESIVGMEVHLRPEGTLFLVCQEGVTPLQDFNPGEWLRYRAIKRASGSTTALTTVEVLLG